MESMRRAIPLLLYATLLKLPGGSSSLVRVPSLLHGVYGQTLLIPVETTFRLDNESIQGTWYQDRPGKIQLVTFTNANAISNKKYEHIFLFQKSTLSLVIQGLTAACEGQYRLELNLVLSNGSRQDEERIVQVTVDVPVSTPVIERRPAAAAAFVEDEDSVMWSCSVENGTRVQYQWMRNNIAIGASERHQFSHDNATLEIIPVRKEDIGQYSCVVQNYINQQQSHSLDLSVFYGPYNLAVNTNQGLRTGEVFTVNPGEQVLFNCWADSNPPNSCVWISKRDNGTEVVMTGPHFMLTPYRLAHTEEFLCRAFNNVTQKQDETQFTLVVASLGMGKERHVQEESSVTPLAALVICSLLIIACMLCVLFRKICHPKRVIMNIYNRPLTEQRGPHQSGHEDATEDFGIYEFVSIPGRMESTQASSRSLARLDSIQDLHTTIYDVIRHIPESPTQSLLK